MSTVNESVYEFSMTVFLLISLVVVLGTASSQGATRCPGPADIVLMVQGSSAIPHTEFELIENLLTDILSYLVIDKNNFRVGLILFGRRPIVMNGLQPFKNRTQLNTLISLMTQRDVHGAMLDGDADIEAAMNEMRSLFTLHALSSQLKNQPIPSKKIGVLFTYTNSSLPPVGSIGRTSTIATAGKAKQEGITLISVVTGSGADDILGMASDECKMFSANGIWSGLVALVPSIANSICFVASKQYPGYAEPDASGSCAHSAATKYQAEEPTRFVCPDLWGIFSDPENCAYYYTCSAGRPRRNLCRNGDLFDTHSNTCNHKDAVTCYSEISCASLNGLFPHPTDCHKFVNCYGGIPYIQECSWNLIFDAKTKICLREGETKCRWS
ncbi:hypothetical protein ScPMuIL_005524 [Solemya velum]